ncbi:DEAD/DEAH box helicase, partial [Vibrio parahaemolyticus]|nr:DEAD/DEAH box helicase [Vibrio parahaemolyticus]
MVHLTDCGKVRACVLPHLHCFYCFFNQKYKVSLMPFSTLSLSSELIHALPKDFKKPTDIQALAIPELLAGQDLLALANT